MPIIRQPKTPLRPEDLKESELYGVLLKARGESKELPDSVLREKIYAAEDFYERDLQIRFRPTRVFSNVYGRQNATFPPGTLDLPNDYDPVRDIDEPAYDYHASFWTDSRWGRFNLNYRPVRSITQMVFTFPGVSALYVVPKPWIQLDRKFGGVQVVPTSGEAIMAVFASFVLAHSAGSRGIPQSIHVDYEIGFTNEELCENHNDLLEGIRLRALLSLGGIFTTVAAPGGQTGGSLSIDGLSRSRSFGGKYGAFSGKIELALQQEQEAREAWRRREQGPMLGFIGR